MRDVVSTEEGSENAGRAESVDGQGCDDEDGRGEGVCGAEEGGVEG